MASPPTGFAASEKKRRSPALRLLLACFVGGLICIPVAAGAALYVALGGLLGAGSMPRLEPSTVQAPDWAAKDRVNFLLLGSDHRDDETGDFGRTDTIIVATLDPQTHSAGMLSIPRDVWLTIPGYGNDRVNAAYGLGEAAKKGGGPELARKTVEQLLGVPIHHYVLIGFGGFEKLINQVGGVTIDVEHPIKDNEYPSPDYSVRRIFFQPGLQHLDGQTALWYVRTRHADSDFGRARRQQQLLLALRKQALQLNLLPKVPSILSALTDSIKTDLRPPEVLALARAAKDIDSSKVVNRVVDESATSHWVTPAGAQVELPDKAAVRQLVREVFASP